MGQVETFMMSAKMVPLQWSENKLGTRLMIDLPPYYNILDIYDILKVRIVALGMSWQ
jgi:hypothetical protein